MLTSSAWWRAFILGTMICFTWWLSTSRPIDWLFLLRFKYVTKWSTYKAPHLEYGLYVSKVNKNLGDHRSYFDKDKNVRWFLVTSIQVLVGRITLYLCCRICSIKNPLNLLRYTHKLILMLRLSTRKKIPFNLLFWVSCILNYETPLKDILRKHRSLNMSRYFKL